MRVSFSAAKNTPEVTVVLPVYNGELFIGRAIESILTQTYEHLELLIVDNHSSDGTLPILKAAAFRDPRVRVLQNDKNMGLVASLNRGIHEARGKYIARMDADDVSRKNRIALQVDFMERNHDVGISGGQIVKHLGGSASRMSMPTDHESIQAMSLFHSPFCHPSVIMRRAVLIEHALLYGEEFNGCEDYDLWSRLLFKTRSANLKDVLIDYHCHDQQITNNRYSHIMAKRNMVRERMVMRLLPDASAADLLLHHRIAYPHEPFTLARLRQAEEWFLRLMQANEKVRIYDASALRSLFSGRWVRICAQAAANGLSAYNLFWRGQFAPSVRFSLPSAKLLVRCALRKGFD